MTNNMLNLNYAQRQAFLKFWNANPELNTVEALSLFWTLEDIPQ